MSSTRKLPPSSPRHLGSRPKKKRYWRYHESFRLLSSRTVLRPRVVRKLERNCSLHYRQTDLSARPRVKLTSFQFPRSPDMAKFYTELNENLREFIGAQRIFFHASAPSQGRINLSPKGLDTFRILSDQRVAYLDLTG